MGLTVTRRSAYPQAVAPHGRSGLLPRNTRAPKGAHPQRAFFIARSPSMADRAGQPRGWPVPGPVVATPHESATQFGLLPDGGGCCNRSSRGRSMSTQAQGASVSQRDSASTINPFISSHSLRFTLENVLGALESVAVVPLPGCPDPNPDRPYFMLHLCMAAALNWEVDQMIHQDSNSSTQQDVSA